MKPFFISDKKTLNQEYQKIDSENLRKAYFSRRRIKTDVENFLEYEFPLHHNFDIIKRHNQGFLNKENLDFFKHLHRLFFKNKYFFEEKNQIIRKAFLLFNKTQTLETIFSETPLKMRKFIIEKNLIDIKMYEELLLRYEDEKSLGVFFPIKNKIETPQEQLKIIDMNAIKFQAQTDQQDLLEENFIVSILEKVNASGLASLVTREIMEFKKIIERRKITLKSLQSNIEAEMNLTKPRGHYRTRTMHPINNLSEDIDKTNPKSDRANTDATEKLNKWNNMKHENTERYIDDNRAIRKKEAKELNNFQNMFKKLKEKKKQEKSEKNKDKFQNIGNLIFRLETVKMNLVSRLNLTEIGQDFTNFHQLSNTKAFFNKYLQNELGLLSENLPESEYFETTKYKAGDSRSSEFFITKKKVILKEIAHKRPTNEKKNLKKKTGKISKFHRFSSKNSYKDDETYSKQNNDNNLLSINESDSEKSDLETKPLKPRKFKTNSFNPEPKQNSNNNDKKDIAFKLNNEVKPIKIDKNPLMLTKYFSEELELSKNDPTQKNDNYKKSVIVENSNSFNLKKEELKVFKKIDFSNKQKIKKLSLNKFTKSSPMPSVSMSLKKGTSKDEDNIIAQTQRKPTYVNNSNEIDEQTIPHAWDHNSLEESQDINLLQSPLNEKKILNLKVLTTISRDKSKKISTVKNLHDNKMEDVQNIESSSIIPQKKNIKKRKVQEKAEEIQIQSINIAKSITSSNSLNSNIQTFEENNNNKIYDNNEIGISNLDSLLAALENKKNQPLRKTYVHKSSILLEVQKKTNTIEKKPTKNDFISSLHKTKTLSPNNSNMESPEIQEMINTYTNAPSKKLKINPELSDMKSRKSLSHPPSFENIEKTHLSINLVSPYNLNFKSGERNIPFWEEDDGKFMVTPLLKISKVVDNTPKYSKVPSKNASFNTFMLKSNENLETFKFDDWKRNSILFQEVKKKEGLIDEEKINQNRQEEPVLSLKKIKKKKNDSEYIFFAKTLNLIFV